MSFWPFIVSLGRAWGRDSIKESQIIRKQKMGDMIGDPLPNFLSGKKYSPLRVLGTVDTMSKSLWAGDGVVSIY